MACFTLTGEQRALMAAALSVGMEGIEDSDSYDYLASIVEEIEASSGPIEITVMPIELPATISPTTFNGCGGPLSATDINDLREAGFLD